MSLSSETKSFKVGRIFIGLNSKGIDPLAPLNETPRFAPDQEQEYMERVRAKAQEAARSVIAKAMDEAEALKHKAQTQGYEEGLAQAAKATDDHNQTLSRKLDDFVQALQSEHTARRAAYAKDTALLLKAALDKVLGVELESHKTDVLEHLLDEALVRIDSRNHITISCSPEDQSFLEDLLARTSQKYPGLEQWTVKPSQALEQGGIKVESGSGMVDNSLASRYALIEEIIQEVSMEDAT